GSLSCRRKAFFKQAGQVGEPADIERVQLQLDRCFTRTALDRFLSQQAESEVLREPPTLETAIQSRPRFIVGATAQAGNLSARLELLERLDDGVEKPLYAPVLFLRNHKVTKNDRLLLAFQALALSLVQDGMPEVAKIVSGSGHRVLRVRLAPLVEEARRVVAGIEADAGSRTPPTLTLN